MKFKEGDFVKLHGLKAQVYNVFTGPVPNGEIHDGATIIYFPQHGVSGPGYQKVRQDQLEPWEGPKSIRDILGEEIK